MGPAVLFERAALNAAAMVEQVRPDQRAGPTPCAEWDVDALIAHMAGGPGYLFGALGLGLQGRSPEQAAYRVTVARCVEALGLPGALDGRCMSPAGFEWSIAEATAGTA